MDTGQGWGHLLRLKLDGLHGAAMAHRIIYQGRKKVRGCVEQLRYLRLEENGARVWMWGRVTWGP